MRLMDLIPAEVGLRSATKRGSHDDDR
jgi:hypothetical protein